MQAERESRASLPLLMPAVGQNSGIVWSHEGDGSSIAYQADFQVIDDIHGFGEGSHRHLYRFFDLEAEPGIL